MSSLIYYLSSPVTPVKNKYAVSHLLPFIYALPCPCIPISLLFLLEHLAQIVMSSWRPSQTLLLLCHLHTTSLHGLISVVHVTLNNNVFVYLSVIFT